MKRKDITRLTAVAAAGIILMAGCGTSVTDNADSITLESADATEIQANIEEAVDTAENDATEEAGSTDSPCGSCQCILLDGI